MIFISFKILYIEKEMAKDGEWEEEKERTKNKMSLF